ncbi:MAG: glycosyltransferase [Nanoarchaeota archaeon]|nr:glycosyltransferase [Nanoarchaeota archaeon]
MEKINEKTIFKEKKNKVKFSLVIPIAPSRNAEILESIKKLDYPKSKFEVIVEKGTNPSENRNRGIKKSKGEFIVFLDDDALINQDYLKEVERFFEKYPEADLVGGPQLTPEENNIFAKISDTLLTSNFGAFKVNKRYRKGEIILDADETMITSANLCVKKEIFGKIDGFNSELYPGEDPELISRAKKAKLAVAYSPNMIVYHKRRPNFTGFLSQIFLYGFTRPRKNKIAEETKLFFLIPMLFTLYFMLMPFLFLLSNLFIIPLVAYILLAIIFAFYDSVRSRSLVNFFVLPLMYLFLHLSYGLGMMAGYGGR